MSVQLEDEEAVEPAVALSVEDGRADGPHPVDRHVGLRVRMRRKELGVSQERLADSLGITFQQVQKYERGANRVSASMITRVATTLGCSVADLFPPEFTGAAPRTDVELAALTLAGRTGGAQVIKELAVLPGWALSLVTTTVAGLSDACS